MPARLDIPYSGIVRRDRFEYPYVLPIVQERLRDVSPLQPIFGAIPVANPGSVEIPFPVSPNLQAEVSFIGFYAWWAIPNPDPETQLQYPLMWVEPDGAPLRATPPFTSGPEVLPTGEGDTIMYTLKFGDKTALRDFHSHTNSMLVPFDGDGLWVPAGESGTLIVERRSSANFVPPTDDNPRGIAWLFFGLWGSRALAGSDFDQMQAKADTSDRFAPAQFAVPRFTAVGGSPTAGVPSLSQMPEATTITIKRKTPVLIDQFRYAGAEHMMLDISWADRYGLLADGPVLARLFNRRISGGWLPTSIVMPLGQDITFRQYQMLLFNDQLDAQGAFSVGGSYLGIS